MFLCLESLLYRLLGGRKSDRESPDKLVNLHPDEMSTTKSIFLKTLFTFMKQQVEAFVAQSVAH